MVGGAAGDDEDAPQAAQKVVAEVDLGEVDLAVVAQPAGERVGERLRLLVDLLEHEGLVAALLGGVGVPGDLALLALERRAGESVNAAPSAEMVTTSPSSSTTTRRVCERKAGMAEAMKVSPSPRPTTSGASCACRR